MAWAANGASILGAIPVPEKTDLPTHGLDEHRASSALDQITSLELVRRAKRGEARALSMLIARYVPFLRRLAHGRIPRWARTSIDTADLVQDTLLNTVRRLHSFEPRGNGAMRAYLRQALQNRIHSVRRDSMRRPQFADLADVHRDQGPTPLELALTANDRERYEHALRELRPDDRQAVIGRVELGYSYEQLAAVLGKATPDAARVAVRRALLRLADAMNRSARPPGQDQLHQSSRIADAGQST